MASRSPVSTSQLGVRRFALTGAIAATIFYALCWVAAFLPIGPATHMYLQLFTGSELSSSSALIQGLVWSAIFGSVAGGLIASIYNGLGSLARR